MITNMSQFIIGQLDQLYKIGTELTFQPALSNAATTSSITYILGQKEIGQNYIKFYFYFSSGYTYYTASPGCYRNGLTFTNIGAVVETVCLFSSFDMRAVTVTFTITTQ